MTDEYDKNLERIEAMKLCGVAIDAISTESYIVARDAAMKVCDIMDRLVEGKIAEVEEEEVLSKCCGSPITVHAFMSYCDDCGRSVNPDDGEPYPRRT